MSFEQINKDDTARPEGRNCILVYGYEPDEIKIIEAFSKEKGIDECVTVTNDLLGNKIEDIINDTTTQVDYKTGVKSKTIIFNAVSNAEVHTFINHFKETELKKPMYAVVTPTSIKWKFGELIKELVREKMKMSKH